MNKYDFNIFDGTNIAGSSDSPFAQFLFDGDQEDIENDQRESEKWKDCQNCNKQSNANKQGQQRKSKLVDMSGALSL